MPFYSFSYTKSYSIEIASCAFSPLKKFHLFRTFVLDKHLFAWYSVILAKLRVCESRCTLTTSYSLRLHPYFIAPPFSLTIIFQEAGRMKETKTRSNNYYSNKTDYREVIREFERAEHAQAERDRSNGVVLRLDIPETRSYIESFYTSDVGNPEKEYFKKLSSELLTNALAQLSKDQYRRIMKYHFDGKSKVQIAKEENVDESAVRRSLERDYETLRGLLTGTELSKQDFEKPVPTRYLKHRREKKKLQEQYPCLIVSNSCKDELSSSQITATDTIPDEGGDTNE